MIVGDIRYPDLKHPRKKISCVDCGISYSNKSYKLLLDNYKLLFFESYSTEMEYIPATLCHDCFFENLGKVSKEEGYEEGMPFYILTKDSEFELNFQPEEFASEDFKSRAEGGDVYMEDFIKDILES